MVHPFYFANCHFLNCHTSQSYQLIDACCDTRLPVIMLVHALHTERVEITNGDGRTATGLVVLTTLPVLFAAAQSVAVEADPVDDQDLRGLVL